MSVARTVPAHAKINLVLRVLAREASGYHTIETLFQRLALHDIVTVRVDTSDRALTCDGPAMPAGGLGQSSDNLAYRAAVAYTNAAAWRTGWDIHIEKHIPVGGGLGGGSADAAAVLRALESLCPTPLGAQQLLALGGTLGADVPFLVADVSRAWAWGRGDRLLVLPPLPPAHVELYAFTHGVNTGAAYAALAASREQDALPSTLSSAWAYGVDAFADWRRTAACATNDFEQVVPAMHEGVRALLPRVHARARALQSSGQFAIGLMTGSGATCVVVSGDDPAWLPPLALPASCTLSPTSTM